MYVIVYNPIAHNRSTQIHLPVASDASFRVERVDDGNQMKYQYIDAVASIPIFDNEESNENDVFRLVFDTGDLPPLGAVAFRITKESRNSVPVPITTPIRENSVTSRQLQRGAQKHIELNNGVFSAEVDISTGMLRGMRVGGTYLGFNQSWGYYESYDASMDSSDQNDQSSGAYIFRPKSSGHAFKHIIPKKQAASFVPISNGMEVHASFEVPWIRQVVRIVADQAFVEVEYIVGPISVSDGRGKEVVSRFVSSIESDGVFYTDSNGREFQKRKRDSRASWDLEVFEPIAGNYYPVNSAIFVEDSNAALTVLVDRSQGGSSLRDGSIELMVQRRTVSDDHRGVDEPLNETCGGMSPYPPYGRSERIGEGVVIRGKHRVLIGKGPIGASLARSALDETFAEPLVFVGSSPVSEPVIFETSTFAALQVALPINIMIVTFMRIRGRRKETFLLRLGHQFAPTEDENLSVPVDLDISNLFSGYNVTSVAETTLSGNAYWYDRLTRRHRWTNRESTSTRAILSDSSQITISPMEIRTFLIEGSEILEDSTRRRAFPDTRTAEMKTD